MRAISAESQERGDERGRAHAQYHRTSGARAARRGLAALLPLAVACGRLSDASSYADLPDAPYRPPALPIARALSDANDAGAASSASAPGLPPIATDPLFTNLAISGFPDAVVSLPNGATSRRPVLIVLHGSGDRPDWNCDAWRHITGARGFVLCPRGAYEARESSQGDRRYTHRGGAYLRAHVDAAIRALQARFGDYVDGEQPLIAGFSLGASEASALAIAAPGRFPRVAVLEGGHDVWTGKAIRAFTDQGGLRVLLGCGSAWCVPIAKATAARLNAGGIEAHRVYANVGHTTDRPLQEAIMTELAWFVGGDPRWIQP
jgi:predicted esterase